MQPRPPSTPKPRSPKQHASLTVGDDCFVSSDSNLSGNITLSSGCIVHPRATISVSQDATLSFGPNCVVEENAVITATSSTTVGGNNTFQVACTVELVAGRAVGQWNVFAPRCEVRGVAVPDECTFGSGTFVGPTHAAVADGRLQNRTVVYGSTSAFRIWDGSAVAQEQGVRASAATFLREVLPKFNKVREEVKVHQASR